MLIVFLSYREMYRTNGFMIYGALEHIQTNTFYQGMYIVTGMYRTVVTRERALYVSNLRMHSYRLQQENLREKLIFYECVNYKEPLKKLRMPYESTNALQRTVQ